MTFSEGLKSGVATGGHGGRSGHAGVASPDAGTPGGSTTCNPSTQGHGAHGQRVIIDLNTEAVLVQTSVTTESDWLEEACAMLDAAGGV